MSTQRASSSPSMRIGARPSAFFNCSSTSSAIVLTCLAFPPLVITKASVMPRASPTDRITVWSPSFESAARAARRDASGTAVSGWSATDRAAAVVNGVLLLARVRRLCSQRWDRPWEARGGGHARRRGGGRAVAGDADDHDGNGQQGGDDHHAHRRGELTLPPGLPQGATTGSGRRFLWFIDGHPAGICS